MNLLRRQADMTHPANGSAPKVERRRGPRQRLSGASSIEASESLRSFRDLTDGLSNRLQMPSLEAMRAGMVNNPMSLMRRFLVAMRSAGLPKDRAQQVAVWVQRQVDCLWPLDQTPLAVLQEKSTLVECEANLAEKRCDLEPTAIRMREEIDAKTRELTCKMLELARLERRMEELPQ